MCDSIIVSLQSFLLNVLNHAETVEIFILQTL